MNPLINTHFREAEIEAAAEFCQPPKPYFQNALVTLYHGDARQVMPELSGVSAVVTDSPYELGFMGKTWDRSGIAFDPEFWDVALTCCLPGAHLLAFGGSRTFHRIACAIEDAGWEMRDTLMWLYGSGFPKSLDVSKAIDKAAGAEREVVGYNTNRPAGNGLGVSVFGVHDGTFSHPETVNQITVPSTDAAKLWNGYGTALKPAFEPIILARKPLCGTVVQNVTEHGCGALNIDGCRVAYEDTKDPATNPLYRAQNGYATKVGSTSGSNNLSFRPEGGELAVNSKGRWPANVIHDGSAEVLRGFPETSSVAGMRGLQNSGQHGGLAESEPKLQNGTNTFRRHTDSGSAARFFYCAKAGGDERDDNTHATVKPLALMEYLCRLIKQPAVNLVLDPFAGSGTTLLACELLGIPCIGIELDEGHCEIIAKRFSKPAEPYLI